MDKKEKAVRLVDVGKLETELDTLLDLMLETLQTKPMKQSAIVKPLLWSPKI